MSTNPNNLVPMPPKVWSDVPTPPRRELLWIKEGRKCHWCGVPTRLVNDNSYDMATTEHIIPRGKGGTNDESNLCSACWRCNNRRSHEDNIGVPDGSLLGKFKQKSPNQVPNRQKNIALTGDEKKAIVYGGKHKEEDVLREQRDQAQKEIASLRKEMQHWTATVAAQETELKSLKSLSVWKFIRKRLAEWIKP